MTMNTGNRALFFASILIAVAMSVSADDKPAVDPAADEAASRLKFMKESAQGYQFTAGTTGGEVLKVQAEPALRWTNPTSDLKDGTLFFWTSADGRPYAAAQLFLVNSGLWIHEFQSLTTDSFRATRNGKDIWTPTKPGIEWKSVPNAPVPAKTPAQRLSQMKAIIRRFGANDDFEGKSRWELRSLATPLLRYSSDREQIVDGATFAFVHTTDPEVLVTIEAHRADGKEPAFRYSLAPMTAYALKVTLDEELVWEKAWTKGKIPITAPYLVMTYKP